MAGASAISGTLTLNNSTVSGNSARSFGSGGTGQAIGGGIYNDGTADLFNSTITNNQADGDFNGTGTGGGIWNQSGSTLTFQNSIVAGNFESQLSNGTFAPAPGECAGTIISNGNNLMQNYDGSHCVVAGQPFTLADPNLGPLENNGGPTRTHALLAGSPAIDAGDPSGCPDQFGALLLKDQRGLRRTADGNRDGAARCDIGAYEFGSGAGFTFYSDVDFDGDGKNDIAVYRDGVWFIHRSRDGGMIETGWGGLPQDIPTPGDYDGEGKADIWWIVRSSDGGWVSQQWGGASQDIPVPADYDGDRKTDIAVYRDGTWYIVRSSDGGVTTTGWGGLPQDIPLNRRSD